MLTRVDSQYRSHRATVHARPVRASSLWDSHSSRARTAAVRDGYPPRRTRSARPNTFGAEQAKYHEPWAGLSDRGQPRSNRLPVSGFLHPHRLKTTPTSPINAS